MTCGVCGEDHERRSPCIIVLKRVVVELRDKLTVASDRISELERNQHVTIVDPTVTTNVTTLPSVTKLMVTPKRDRAAYMVEFRRKRRMANG